MRSEENQSDTGDQKDEVRSKLYRERIIKDLESKFDLTEELTDAAILIFRLFVGLGKGLTDSQRKSFSAASVWYAAKIMKNRKLNKNKLAKAVDISTRTLARRFKEIEEDKETKPVLDYVKERIKKWSRERNRKLKRLL